MCKSKAKSKKMDKAKSRKLYFRVLKKIMKVRYKEPTFIYLGDEIENGSLILSNHEGTDAPMALEIYLNKPIRMWGAGDSFLIYPGYRSSVRFERLVEGIQDAEKIRILREEYKANGNIEAAAELEKLVNTFAEGEMNAQNAGEKVKALEKVLNR